MKLQSKLAAGLAAMALSLGAQAAPIDLFSLDQGPHSDATPTPADTGTIITAGVGDSVGVGDATILGGNRDLFASLLTNGGVATREVQIGVSGGVLDFSVDTLATGRGQIQWDGPEGTEAIDHTGLGNHDLTAGGTLSNFKVDIIFSDGGFNFEITAYTDALNYTNISFVSTAHPVPASTLIPFAAFETPALCGVPNPAPGVLLITCVGAGADMSDLGALVVDLDRFGGTTSIDLTLDGITTVPEPGTLLLIGAALLGLGGMGRRGKNAA